MLVDGFLVDIVRGDLLIEIQTRNFSALKRKLANLAAQHRVRLVYPIPREKWIVKVSDDGAALGRRKSPKRGAVEHLFDEFVSLPHLLANPNFSVEVLLIQEEEVRRHDAKRAWRRKGWVTEERRLLDVVERRVFETPADMAPFLPDSLPEPFTTTDLAAALGRPVRLARKVAYCLRAMGVITAAGKRGNAILYTRGNPEPPAARPPKGRAPSGRRTR
ncbi:MAG: hypothetical protein JXR94_02515 [Candidatus Hydrogenedentes bacterium]|nr:hypothetical protein [Candidatus Hydrogenedentota bacterium]